MAVRFNNYEPGAAFASLLDKQDQAYQDRLALGWVPSERDPDDGWAGSLWDSAWGAGYSTLGGALNTLGILTDSDTVYGWGNDLNKRSAALTDRNNDYNDGTKSRLNSWYLPTFEYLTDPHGLWNEGGTLLGSSLPGMAAGAFIAASAPEAAVIGGVAALASAGMEMGANFGQGYADKKRDNIEQAIKNGDHSKSLWDNNIDQGAWADLTKDPYKNAELMASSLMDTALDVAGGATKGLGSMIAKETGLGKALASGGGKVVESMLGDSVRSEALLGKALNVANRAHLPGTVRYIGDRALDAGAEGFQEAWQQRIQDAMNGNFDDDGTGRDKALSFFDSIVGNSDFTDNEINAAQAAALPTFIKGAVGSGLRTVGQKIDNAYLAPKAQDRTSENLFHISTVDAQNDDGTPGAQFSVFDKYDNSSRLNVLEGLSNANLDAINTNIDAFNKANEALPEDQRPGVVEHLTPEMIEAAKGDGNEAALATRNISNALLIPENRSVLAETVKGAREGRKASISETKDNIKNTIKALGSSDENSVKSGVDSANSIISAVSPTWAASDINELSKGPTYAINQATMDAAREGNTKALRDVLRAIKPDTHVDTVKGRQRKSESYKREINNELNAYEKDGDKEHLNKAKDITREATTNGFITEEESKTFADAIQKTESGEKQTITIDADAKVTDDKVVDEGTQNTQDAQNASKTSSERGIEEKPRVEGTTTTPTADDAQKDASTAQNAQPEGQPQSATPQDNNTTQTTENTTATQSGPAKDNSTAQEPVKDTTTQTEVNDAQSTPNTDTQNPQNGVKTDSGKGVGGVPSAQGVTTTPTTTEAPKAPVKPTKEQNKKAGNIGGRITKYGNSIKADKRKPEQVKAFADKVENDIKNADITDEQKKTLLDRVAKIRASVRESAAEQPTNVATPTTIGNNTQTNIGAETTTAQPSDNNNATQNEGERTNESDKNATSETAQTSESGKNNEAKEGAETRGSEGEQGRSTETNSSNKTKEANSGNVSDDSEQNSLDETDDSFELDVTPDDDATETVEDYDAKISSKVKGLKPDEDTPTPKSEKSKEEIAGNKKKWDTAEEAAKLTKGSFGYNTQLSDVITMQCIDGAANFVKAQNGKGVINVAKRNIGKVLSKVGLKNIDYFKYRALIGPLFRLGFNYMGDQIGVNPGLNEYGKYAQSMEDSSLDLYSVIFPAINTAILNYKDFRKRAEKAGITPASLNTYFYYCLQAAVNDYKDNWSNNGLITRQEVDNSVNAISTFLYDDLSLSDTGMYESFVSKLTEALKKEKLDLSSLNLTSNDILSMMPGETEGNSYVNYISTVVGSAANSRFILYKNRGEKKSKEDVAIEAFVDYTRAVSRSKAKREELKLKKDIARVAEIYSADRVADEKLKNNLQQSVQNTSFGFLNVLRNMTHINPEELAYGCFKYAMEGLDPSDPKTLAKKMAINSALNSLRVARATRHDTEKFINTARKLIARRVGMTTTSKSSTEAAVAAHNEIAVLMGKTDDKQLKRAGEYITDLSENGDIRGVELALIALAYSNVETSERDVHGPGNIIGVKEYFKGDIGIYNQALVHLGAAAAGHNLNLSEEEIKRVAELRRNFFGESAQKQGKKTDVSRDKSGTKKDAERESGKVSGRRGATWTKSAEATSAGILSTEGRDVELANLAYIIALTKPADKRSDDTTVKIADMVIDMSEAAARVNMLAIDSFVISTFLDIKNAKVKDGLYNNPMSATNKAYHLQAHLLNYIERGGNAGYAYGIIKKIANVLPSYKAYRSGEKVLKGREARDYLNNLFKEMLSSDEGRIALGLKRDKSGGLFDKFGFVRAKVATERTPNDESNRLPPRRKKNSVYNQNKPVKISAKYSKTDKINKTIRELENIISELAPNDNVRDELLNRLRGAMMNLNKTIASVERQASRDLATTDSLFLLKAIFTAKHELMPVDSIIFQNFMVKKVEDELLKMLNDAKKSKKLPYTSQNLDPGLRRVPDAPASVLGFAGRKSTDKDFTESFNRDDPNIITYNGKMYRLTDSQKKKYDSFLSKDGKIDDNKLKERDRFCKSVCIDPGGTGENGKVPNRVVEFPYSERFSGVSDATNMLKDRYGYTYLNRAIRSGSSNGIYLYAAQDGLSSYISTLANIFFEKADEDGMTYNNSLIRAIVLRTMIKDGKFNPEEIKRIAEDTNDFDNVDKLIGLAQKALNDVDIFIETEMLNRASKMANKNRKDIAKENKDKSITRDANTHQMDYIKDDIDAIKEERTKREKKIREKERRKKEKEKKRKEEEVKKKKELHESIAREIEKLKEARKNEEERRKKEEAVLRRARNICRNIDSSIKSIENKVNKGQLSQKELKSALVKLGKAYANGVITRDMYDKYLERIKRAAIKYKARSEKVAVKDYTTETTPSTPTVSRVGNYSLFKPKAGSRSNIVSLMDSAKVVAKTVIEKAVAFSASANTFGEYIFSPLVSKKINHIFSDSDLTDLAVYEDFAHYNSHKEYGDLGTSNPLQGVLIQVLALQNSLDMYKYEFNKNWFDDVPGVPGGKILNLDKINISKLTKKEKGMLLFFLAKDILETSAMSVKQLSALEELFDMPNKDIKETYGFAVAASILGLNNRLNELTTNSGFFVNYQAEEYHFESSKEEKTFEDLSGRYVPSINGMEGFTKTFKERVSRAKKIINDVLEDHGSSLSFAGRMYEKTIRSFLRENFKIGFGITTRGDEETILFYQLLRKFNEKLGKFVEMKRNTEEGISGKFSANKDAGVISTNGDIATTAHEMSHAILHALLAQDLESGKLKAILRKRTIVYSKKHGNGTPREETRNALKAFLLGAMKEFDGRDDAVSNLAKSVFDMLPEEYTGDEFLDDVTHGLLDSDIMTVTNDGNIVLKLDGAAYKTEMAKHGKRDAVIAYETIFSLLECAEYIKNEEVNSLAYLALQEAYNYRFNKAVETDDKESMMSWFVNTMDMLDGVTGETGFYHNVQSVTTFQENEKAPAIKTKPEKKEKKFKHGETGSSPTSNARLGNAKPDYGKYNNFQQKIIKATNGHLGDKVAAQTARLKKHPVRWFSKSYKSAISMLRNMGVPEEICLHVETLTQTCMSNQQRFHELDQARLEALANILSVKGNQKSTRRIMDEAYRMINNNSDRGRDIVEHVTFGNGQYIKLYAQDIFEVRRGFDSEENAKTVMNEWLKKKKEKMDENNQGKDIVWGKVSYYYTPETGTIIIYVPNQKSLGENGEYKNVGQFKYGKESDWGKEEAKLMNRDMAECEYLHRKNLENSPNKYTKDEIDRIINFWKGHKETMLECYVREKKRELLADDIINRQKLGYMHAYSPRVYSRYLLIEKRYSKKPVENPPKDWDAKKDDVFGQYEFELLPDGKVYHVEYAGIGSFSSQKERWKYRQNHPLTGSKNMYIEATRDEYLNVSGGRNDVTSVSDSNTRTISDEDIALARKKIESHATGKLANLIIREIPKDEKFTPNKMRTMINKLLDDEMSNEEGYNTNDIKAMRAVLNSIVDSPGLEKIQTFGEFAGKVKEEGAQYLSAGYAKERNSSSGLYDHDVMRALQTYMFTTANIAALAPIHREITKVIKQATGKDYRATRGTSEESLYNLGCEIMDTIEGRDAPIDGFVRKLSASTAAFLNQMPIFKQIADATGIYMPELWMTGIMNKGMTWTALLLLGCWNAITAMAQYSQMNNVRAYVGDGVFLEAMNECKGTLLKLNTKNVLSGKFDLKQFPPEVQQVLIDQYLTKEGTDSNTKEQEEAFQKRVAEGDEEAVKLQSMIDTLGIKDVRTGGVGTNNLAYQITNAGNQFAPTNSLNPVYRSTKMGQLAGIIREVFDSGMSLFRASDTSCRIVAAVAAYKMMNKDEDFQAKLKGKDEKEQSLMKRIYIQDVVNKTNFNFNRATDPILLHNLGQVGRTVFQFGKFGLLNLDYIANLYHKRGGKGVANYLAGTFLTSGIWAGIPCATAFAGMCQAVLGCNPEDWMKKLIMRACAEGKLPKPVAETALYGIFAPIAGIDISKKVGLADSIRDPTDTKNLLGPVFGKLGEFTEAVGATRKFFTDDAFTRDQLLFAWIRSFPMAAKIYQAYTGRYYSYNKFTPKTAEGSMPWEDRVKMLLGGSPISNRMDTDVNRYIIDANKKYSDEVRSAMMEYYANPSAENEAKLAEYGKTGKDAQKMAEKLIKKKLTADEAEAMTTKGKSERAQQVRQDARDLGAFLDM